MNIHNPKAKSSSPISKLLPMPTLTRRREVRQPLLRTGDEPQLLPNKNNLSFKSYRLCGDCCSLLSSDSNLLSGKSLAAHLIPGKVQQDLTCSQPAPPGRTPELPTTYNNFITPLWSCQWLFLSHKDLVQKYSIGTRDVLGERMLNEGDNLSNHTIIFVSLKKGEGKER